MKREENLLTWYMGEFSFGIVGIFLVWLGEIPWSTFLNSGNPGVDFFLGTLVAILNIGIMWGMVKLFPDAFSKSNDDKARSRTRFLIQLNHVHLFALMALVGIAEEIFFRAAIQSILIRILPFFPLAIVIASALFSLAHLENIRKPFALASVFIVGLTLGWLFWFTGNLWAAAWSHFLYDITLILGIKWAYKRDPSLLQGEDEAVHDPIPTEARERDIDRDGERKNGGSQWVRFLLGFLMGLVVILVIFLLKG
ncbi:membrane hypothetical protein [[Clostridium] ultunense Esp]|nr:membrane hypothetical protein [[Clostridium] ultunense Esp]